MDGLFETMDGIGAEFSPCGVYRYTLTRQWADGPCVAFLMFNPSTATVTEDDPTIRKCIGFAKRWGYGRLVILNLYAIRGTDPRTPSRAVDPIGPMNDHWILETCKEARQVVCAWGCAQHMPTIVERMMRVLTLLQAYDVRVSCLGYRKDSHPRHPLMLSYETKMETFVWGL